MSNFEPCDFNVGVGDSKFGVFFKAESAGSMSVISERHAIAVNADFNITWRLDENSFKSALASFLDELSIDFQTGRAVGENVENVAVHPIDFKTDRFLARHFDFDMGVTFDQTLK